MHLEKGELSTEGDVHERVGERSPRLTDSMHFLKLILRNTLRHKLRTGLTVLGLVVAILAFGLLQTIVDAWYAGAESAASEPAHHAQRDLARRSRCRCTTAKRSAASTA